MDEGGFDAELLQVDVEQRVRAAIERGCGDDMVTGAAQREEGGRLGGLAGRAGERRAPILDRRHALLEHRYSRCRDARLDLADGLQVVPRRRETVVFASAR